MNGRVCKPQSRPSRVKLSKVSQEKLLEAVAHTATLETSEGYTEQLPVDISPSLNGFIVQPTKRQLETPESYTKYSPVDINLPRNEPTLQSKKRRLEIETETQNDQVSTKKPRLNQINTAQQSEDVEIKHINIQQPKPQAPQHSYASFLKNSVDPPTSNCRSESVHSFVFEWLNNIGLDQEERCRSDSYLHYRDNNSVSRQLTRSAPGMSCTKDGFPIPPTPASAGSRSRRAGAESIRPSDASGASSSRWSAKTLVEDALYRSVNLAQNNIYMRYQCDPLPEDVNRLVDSMRRDRSSPGPSLDEIRQDKGLYSLSMGAGEPEVTRYLGAHIFPDLPVLDDLKRTERTPMAKHAVPSPSSSYKVSNPIPDMLYGYSRDAFPQQQTQLVSMGPEMVANNKDLLYPFFVIEFKGDGPTGAGSLWVATNQCLGGSASCVEIAERLNRQLRQCKSDKIKPIDTAAFSIATNGTEARLYISWRHNELDCYLQTVSAFVLQDPEQYLQFRTYVRNIIDWGANERLQAIQNSLDNLLEESRLGVS